MTLDAAVIKEQGVTFAIVVVKPAVLNSQNDCASMRNSCSSIFPDMPIILMSQDNKGIPTYQGKKDIVKFLANIHISQIPFKRYTI